MIALSQSRPGDRSTTNKLHHHHHHHQQTEKSGFLRLGNQRKKQEIMSEPQNPPKLFLHKPKKGSHPPGGEMAEPRVFVQKQQQPVASSLPPLPKAPFWYRYRAGVGALLLVNLGIGGYVLTRPQLVIDANPLKPEKPESEAVKEKNHHPPQAAAVPVAASSSSVAAAATEWAPPPKATISEEEQREMLQWVLDERRKLKDLNKDEKARIDEEKRLLKQFLRGNHLPPLF